MLHEEEPGQLRGPAPLTSRNRSSQYEMRMPCVPWLKHQSFANLWAIAAYEHHELLEHRGRFDRLALERSLVLRLDTRLTGRGIKLHSGSVLLGVILVRCQDYRMVFGSMTLMLRAWHVATISFTTAM
jgi:hypothetical protein